MRMRPGPLIAAVALLLGGPAVAQDRAADATVRAILSSPGQRQA